MTDIAKLNELVELAKELNGEDWRYSRTTPYSNGYITGKDGRTIVETTNGEVPANACRFIEMANPATILAIAEAFRALEQRAEAAEAGFRENEQTKQELFVIRDNLLTANLNAGKRIRELEAKLAGPQGPLTIHRDEAQPHLQAVCRVLAKHFADDPAVTFENAAGLVQHLIDDGNNAANQFNNERFRADKLLAMLKQEQEKGQQVGEKQISPDTLRALVSQFGGGLPTDPIAALREMLINLAELVPGDTKRMDCGGTGIAEEPSDDSLGSGCGGCCGTGKSPVYTAPPVPALRLPDEKWINSQPGWESEDSYPDGWNACLSEVKRLNGMEVSDGE